MTTENWEEIKTSMEATCPYCKIEKDRKDLGLKTRLENKNIVLVEVNNMGILPIFDQITHELSSNGKDMIFPVIGAITPYDLRGLWKELGNKGGFWITNSENKDEWVNQKFVVGTPSSLFQLIEYFKTACDKYGENCIFVGDFLDEVHSNISEEQVHKLISRLKSLLQQRKAMLVIIIDKGIHTEKEVRILERYADIKITFNGKDEDILLYDFKTNQEEIIGKL